MALALLAQDITKTFVEARQQVTVLRGVSLELARGEVVALEGPSGSGKTTLLSILGCILTATGGRLVVDGQVVHPGVPSHLTKLRRERIGFVFQQYNLFPALTAHENVEYALNIKGLRGPEATTESMRALREVGMGDRLDFLPRDLSGGQKQRVAIARAVASQPAILLADEPTANLDTALGAQVLDLFASQARAHQRAVLIVTHDPAVRRVCDRVIQIRDGKIAA